MLTVDQALNGNYSREIVINYEKRPTDGKSDLDRYVKDIVQDNKEIFECVVF